MDTTHLHLLLNHFPIIGTLIGSGLLFFGIIKKQDNIKTDSIIYFIYYGITGHSSIFNR